MIVRQLRTYAAQISCRSRTFIIQLNNLTKKWTTSPLKIYYHAGSNEMGFLRACVCACVAVAAAAWTAVFHTLLGLVVTCAHTSKQPTNGPTRRGSVSDTAMDNHLTI